MTAELGDAIAAQAETDSSTYAVDADVVHLTGDEVIDGIKTFAQLLGQLRASGFATGNDTDLHRCGPGFLVDTGGLEAVWAGVTETGPMPVGPGDWSAGNRNDALDGHIWAG